MSSAGVNMPPFQGFSYFVEIFYNHVIPSGFVFISVDLEECALLDRVSRGDRIARSGAWVTPEK
jgi:hypothetical protein